MVRVLPWCTALHSSDIGFGIKKNIIQIYPFYMVSREKGEISSALLVCIQMQCTGALAGSHSEGATLSQFIILTKKGKHL